MKQYFAFQWHITDDCDQRCKHCYIFAEDNCKALTEMPWEKMKQHPDIPTVSAFLHRKLFVSAYIFLQRLKKR